jgi:hypothetical protein
MIEGLFEWPSRRGRLLVVGATLACLAPFLGKAFHIDDPVYVEVAQQILRSPLDFFGPR